MDMAGEQRRISFHGSGFSNIMYRAGVCSYELPDAHITADAPRCRESDNHGPSHAPSLLRYDEWQSWGTTWQCNSCLFAGATCGDLKLCVKIAINLEKEPPRDADSIFYERTRVSAHLSVAQSFLDEYKFYRDHLQELQGTLVPRHYGLWRFNSTWGGVVLLSIFEWAGSPSFPLFYRTLANKDTTEYRVACIQAVREFHKRGISHGQLIGICNIRHILFDLETRTARLIDFTSSSADHECNGPNFPVPHGSDNFPGCCDEVASVAGAFQYYNYVPPIHETRL
ncbi:hypothetical protein HGRIS_007267 [Hohenbuehelia grisea]|uniref:Protein kinase domain-containing protein n=1 Tax=Hohenbuehelia grisea TaxID=104357 RepID=A0ABR3JBV4_9AGAR